MDDSTTNNPQDLLHQIQALLFKYSRLVQGPLVKLLYKKGATQVEIGKALGTKDSIVSRKFPRRKQ